MRKGVWSEMFTDLPEKGYQRMLVLLLYGGLAALAAVVFFRWLWKPVLPFLLGGILALFLQKPLDALDAWTGHRRTLRAVWAVLLVLVSVGAILGLLVFLGSRLFSEARGLGEWFADNIGKIAEDADALLLRLRAFLAALPGGRADGSSVLFQLIDSADTLIAELLQSAAAGLSARIPAWLGTIAAALPRFLLAVVVMLLAAVYLTLDGRALGAFLSRCFPERTASFFRRLRGSFFSTLILYGRAYLILIVITFSELYAGFLILGTPYALAAAAGIAVIDILPVLGTGTVLLPWAAVEFFGGAWGRGTGLLLLYTFITVVRQIIEPRIVGRHIGLHPLAALLSMYLGVRLFGVPGLLLLPLAASVLWKYLSERRPPETGTEKDACDKRGTDAPKHTADSRPNRNNAPKAAPVRAETKGRI